MANLTNINNKFLVTTGGDVGIGTTSPRSKLEVNGGIMMQNGENLEWGDTYANNAPTIFASTNYLQFAPTGASGVASNSMKLTTTGLGVGTTSPAVSLDVNAGTSDTIARFESTDNRGRIQIDDNDTTVYAIAEGSKMSLGTSNTLSSTNLTIDSSGQVGIGETSPLVDLHVRDSSQNSNITDTVPSWWNGLFERTYTTTSNAAIGIVGSTQALGAGGVIYLGYSDDVDNNWIGVLSSQAMTFGTNTVERMRITSGGDVLMGNTVVNPASGFSNQRGFGYDNSTGNLQIASTSGNAFVVGRNEASDGTIIELRKESNIVGTLGSNTTSGQMLLDISGSSSNGNIRFVTNGAEVMRITSAYNVGIGTSSPNDGDLTINAPKLHVFGPSTSGVYNLAARFQGGNDSDNTGSAILINHSNDRGLLIKAGRKDGDREVAYFDVISSGGNITNMLTMGKFGSDYNVGIGTTSPSSKFDLRGTAYITGYTVGFDTSPQGNYAYRLTNDGANSFINVLGGNLGIGTTAPAYKLDVNGGIRLNGKSALTDNGYFIGAPSYGFRWNNNADTFNNVIMYDNGNMYVRGNVGIGTTSPSAKLEIEDSGADLLDLTRTSVGTYRLAISIGDNFSIYDVGAASDRLIIDSSGKVIVSNSGATNIGILQLSSSVTSYFLRGGANYGYLSYHTGGYHRWFGSDGAEDMRLNSTGLGIGTTSPSQALDVNGYIKATNEGAGYVQGVFVAHSSTLDTPSYRGQGYFTYNEGHDVSWFMGTPYTNGDFFCINRQHSTASFDTAAAHIGNTNTDNFFSITNTGNVGIGTVSPSAKLEIVGSNGTNIFRGNFGGSADIFMGFDNANPYLTLQDNSNVTTHLFQSNVNNYIVNSNVGIGTTGPSDKLEVTTSASQYTGRFDYTGSSGGAYGCLKLRISANTSPSFIDLFYDGFSTNPLSPVGAIVTTGSAVLYSSFSDYRLKENVANLTGALDRVNSLQPKTFNYINRPETTNEGFLAHELQEIVPQAVSGTKDGVDEQGNPKYQGVDNAHLVPLLVGAIKELEARVKELENK